ncbi:hypothetical protein LLEC1_04166 [Akanthomyces lecanii]|uniref:RTA1 like protein n=1 Tax=Cordyceps confragosa TaxID=2714763 RepID=A0A179I8C5_CORDF|nr:hypothetical protein LLEC1_04166 [Akanthomyces lecanii]
MSSQLDPNGWTNEDWLLKRYKYVPSTAAAIIFAVLFGASTAVHLFQLLRTKTWYFIPFLVGGLFETSGYIMRALDTKAASKLLFINQTSVILLAPALYAASIYMILKRVIILLDAQAYSLIRVQWLTRVFVGGDVVSFLLQGAGGAMQASDASVKPGRQDLAKILVVGGLVLQLVAFSFFVILTAAFHLRIRRQPTVASAALDIPWVRYTYVLYFGSSMVMIRSIFRVIEYIQGRDGYLISHEVFFYVLDATMMLVVSIEFNAAHPSKLAWSSRKHELSLLR